MKSGPRLRMAAPAAWAVLLLLLPGSLAAAPAPREDVLSSEPGRMAPAPGEDALTTLPPGESQEKAPPSPAPPAAQGPPAQPSGAGVEVLNGSGFGGHAAFWARRLREQGLTIGRVANAERLDHPQTLIYYAEGAEGVAIEVRRILGRTGKLQPRGRMGGRHPVVVVLGRDLPREGGKKPDSR